MYSDTSYKQNILELVFITYYVSHDMITRTDKRYPSDECDPKMLTLTKDQAKKTTTHDAKLIKGLASLDPKILEIEC